MNCIRFGDFSDDRDVVAKHEQEDDETAALAAALSSSEAFAEAIADAANAEAHAHADAAVEAGAKKDATTCATAFEAAPSAEVSDLPLRKYLRTPGKTQAPAGV